MLSIYYKGWKDLSKLQKIDELHVINWIINEWKQIASQLSDEKGVHKFMYIFSVHIYRKPTIRRRKENQKEKFRRIFQHNHQRNLADRILYKPDILLWKMSCQCGRWWINFVKFLTFSPGVSSCRSVLLHRPSPLRTRTLQLWQKILTITMGKSLPLWHQ